LFGQHFSGQQQFSHSSGQHFGGQQPSSDCPGLFCAGQQLVVASPAQHGSVRPKGQTFASDPASAFRAHSTLAFSAKKAFAPERGVLFFA